MHWHGLARLATCGPCLKASRTLLRLVAANHRQLLSAHLDAATLPHTSSFKSCRLWAGHIIPVEGNVTYSTSTTTRQARSREIENSAGITTTTSSSNSSHRSNYSTFTTTSSSDSSSSSTTTTTTTIDNSSSSNTSRSSQGSVDKREAAKFAALADKWWDKVNGPFAALHALNTARCTFLRAGLCSLRGMNPNTAEPLSGIRVLDVGCGGGLLSEHIARMGAQVTGIDVSAEGVAAAAAHAAGDPVLVQRIRYMQSTLEDLVASGASFDVVMASEVIEHVKRPQQFVESLAAATAPGGQVFVTTLNRTPASYALAIVGAEYVMRVVPAGTHSWTKFITPQELAMMARDAGISMHLLAGMVLQPSGQFTLDDSDLTVNYAALMQKPA